MQKSGACAAAPHLQLCLPPGRIANLCRLDCACIASHSPAAARLIHFMHACVCVCMYVQMNAYKSSLQVPHQLHVSCRLQQAQRVYSDSKPLSAHRRHLYLSRSSSSMHINKPLQGLDLPARLMHACEHCDVPKHTSLECMQPRSCIFIDIRVCVQISGHTLLRGLDMLTRLSHTSSMI